MISRRNSFYTTSTFVEPFNVYVKNCTHHMSMEKMIQEMVIPNIMHLLQGEHMTILSLGTGPGVPDAMLLQAMNGSVGKGSANFSVSYTAVEPRREYMEIIQRDLTNIAKNLSIDVNLSWKETTGEEFVKETEGHTFDLICFIHALYYIEPEKVLSQCMNLLSPKGRLVIVMDTDAAFINRIGPMLKEIMDKITEKNAEEPVNVYLTAEAIIPQVKALGRRFITMTTEFQTDITECFMENSADGLKLVDLYSHTENTRQKCGEDVWKSILQIMSDNSNEDSEGRKIASSTQTMILLLNEESS